MEAPQELDENHETWKILFDSMDDFGGTPLLGSPSYGFV